RDRVDAQVQQGPAAQLPREQPEPRIGGEPLAVLGGQVDDIAERFGGEDLAHPRDVRQRTAGLLCVALRPAKLFPQAEGGGPGQAAMHLPWVIEVEVLAHVRRAGVTLAARVQRVPEGMLVAADPLKRVGGGVVDLLAEQGVVPGGTCGTEHAGMVGEAVGGGRRLLVPVTALRDEPGAKVYEAVV